jgi:sulfur carrier protein ThiS
LNRRLRRAADQLQDKSLVVSVNGEMILSNEKEIPVKNGDVLAVFPLLGGG